MFRTRTSTSLSRRRSNASQKSNAATGFIVEREIEALAELKKLCRKRSITWLKSDLVTWDTTDDIAEDSNLLRYLRARKYDVDAAFKQYAASAKWRYDIQLEKSYDDVEITRFETIRRLQPQWTGRRDVTGVPIMVYVVSQVKGEDIFMLHKVDPALSSVFLAAEYVTQFVQPFCGELEHQCITTSINIIDLSNVGVPTFWRMRKLLDTASDMATAHYPETVKKIYIVGAPSFFSTIWRYITLWFEPATTRKIMVLGHGKSAEVLRHELGSENVPKRFGGDLNWEFGECPNLNPDAALLSKKLVDKWVEGPLRLIKGPGENYRIIAVGSEHGRLRRDDL